MSFQKHSQLLYLDDQPRVTPEQEVDLNNLACKFYYLKDSNGKSSTDINVIIDTFKLSNTAVSLYNLAYLYWKRYIKGKENSDKIFYYCKKCVEHKEYIEGDNALSNRINSLLGNIHYCIALSSQTPKLLGNYSHALFYLTRKMENLSDKLKKENMYVLGKIYEKTSIYWGDMRNDHKLFMNLQVAFQYYYNAAVYDTVKERNVNEIKERESKIKIIENDKTNKLDNKLENSITHNLLFGKGCEYAKEKAQDIYVVLQMLSRRYNG